MNMDKRIARVAVLLATVGWSLIAPQPAQAQLGTGSLIVTVTSPASGSSVSGTNFTGATAVLFNGTSASYTVSSATTITATVPAGATTGPISVITSGGMASSVGSFTVVSDATRPTVTINQAVGQADPTNSS